MKVIWFVTVVLAVQVDSQFWKNPQELFNPFSWLRQAKTAPAEKENKTQAFIPIPLSTQPPAPLLNSTTFITTTSPPQSSPKAIAKAATTNSESTNKSSESRLTTKRAMKNKSTTPVMTTTKYVTMTTRHSNPIWTTVPITTQTSTRVAYKDAKNVTEREKLSTVGAGATATVTEATTMLDTTTQEVTGTTEEPRDNHRVHDFYLSKREKPQVKIASNISQNLLPLPAGASAALVKPTKYHYYPHNQHIYLLPECAVQQVCNAVYVRLNWTQPLCACPSRYRDPCSASLNSDDQHTTELMIDRNSKRALTLVKTCEPTTEMRICRSPRDWSLLALQNIRTGKSHYLVICRCPDTSILEGPMSHDQPTYASVPGIRVYGMMCVQPANKRRGRPLRMSRSLENPPFPWHKAVAFSKTVVWED